MGKALAEGEGAVPAGRGVLVLGARLVNTDGMAVDSTEVCAWRAVSGLLTIAGTICGRSYGLHRAGFLYVSCMIHDLQLVTTSATNDFRKRVKLPDER